MSITVEGQPVAGFLENILSLAADDPERFGLERDHSDPNFTFEEVATVLNRGESSDRVLDERDRDYFVSRGLMTSRDFLIVANFFDSPALRRQTRFSVSPALRHEISDAIAADHAERCDEIRGRLLRRGIEGVAELLGLGSFIASGSPVLLGTALMIGGAGGLDDLVEYRNEGCAN